MGKITEFLKMILAFAMVVGYFAFGIFLSVILPVLIFGSVYNWIWG